MSSSSHRVLRHAVAAICVALSASPMPPNSRETRAPRRRQREFADGRPCRPRAPARLRTHRETAALRSRAHSGTGRACTRHRRIRRVRADRRHLEPDESEGLHTRHPHARVRALLHRDGLSRLARTGARSARFRGEVLYATGQLGHGRHQLARVLHSRRHQVPRLRSREQAERRDRRAGPEPCVRLLRAHARSDEHPDDAVHECGHARFVSSHGRLRGARVRSSMRTATCTT